MLKNGQRELAYIVKVDEVRPIPNYDKVEHVRVNGWWVICKLGQFKPGDYAVYFEVDSKVPEVEPFMFLAPKHFKVKTQRMCKTISQGLLMSFDDFILDPSAPPAWVVSIKHRINSGKEVENEGLTEVLGVTYSVKEDNKRKSTFDKYKSMMQRHPKIFSQSWAKWMMKRKWGSKVMFFFFGKKKDDKRGWPTGRFPGVSKTDQERVENMPWVLNDKTPYLVTQKCDGSSGTYILERKKFNKFEFYVCSRNVRMFKDNQSCYYEDNIYWEMAEKYHIYDKMKKFLESAPDVTFVCWQGEICGPKIQGNPQHLSENHLFLFHWTDSVNGRMDLLTAHDTWLSYDMEVVPIMGETVFPDNLDELKKEADGFYDPSVCEGQKNCSREGLVYYKTTDPNYSFKNVSNKYLLKEGK